MIKFKNGAAVFLEASWASNIETDEIFVDLMGTKAGCSSRGGWKIFREECGGQLDCLPNRLPSVETAQHHFADCILKGKTPICPGEHGLYVQRILDAIYESSGGIK